MLIAMWSNGCLAGMEDFQDLSILHYEYSLTLSYRMDKIVTLTHLNILVVFFIQPQSPLACSLLLQISLN